MSIIAISVIVVATIIGVLMQVAKKLKKKDDARTVFYIKDIKAVMVAVITIEIAFVMAVFFLTKVSF